MIKEVLLRSGLILWCQDQGAYILLIQLRIWRKFSKSKKVQNVPASILAFAKYSHLISHVTRGYAFDS